LIIEERQYRIAAGRLSEYLAIYENLGLQIQSRILGNLIGYFSSEIGELSCLVHLWGYESLDDRALRRAELAKQPEWQDYLRQCTPLIVHMENRILLPTRFSPIR